MHGAVKIAQAGEYVLRVMDGGKEGDGVTPLMCCILS